MYIYIHISEIPIMTLPLAKIGVISIGDMGMGIAKLLIANGFSVATNCKGRRSVHPPPNRAAYRIAPC